MREHIRTTNFIERSFKEVRRRTRPIGCFNNAESCERIIYAVFIYLNSKWESDPLIRICAQLLTGNGGREREKGSLVDGGSP